jgi:hypothetical protein
MQDVKVKMVLAKIVDDGNEVGVMGFYHDLCSQNSKHYIRILSANAKPLSTRKWPFTDKTMLAVVCESSEVDGIRADTIIFDRVMDYVMDNVHSKENASVEISRTTLYDLDAIMAHQNLYGKLIGTKEDIIE